MASQPQEASSPEPAPQSRAPEPAPQSRAPEPAPQNSTRQQACTQSLARPLGRTLLYVLIALPIGLICGAIDAVFGRVLITLGLYRDAHVFLLLPLLPLAGAVIAWVYKHFGKEASRGMGLIFDVGHDEAPVIPLRLVPLIMGSTWLTHLCGGSAGREGVAVQIGATISHWIGKRIPLRDSNRTFLVVGMAAGFAGLFQTPLAATLFALEVLVVGKLELPALVPALFASLVASTTSHALGLEKFEVSLAAQGIQWTLDAATVVKLSVLGLLFGLIGGLFAWCLSWAKKHAAQSITHPVKRIFLMGLVLSVLFLLLWQGRYSGLGTNLISASLVDGYHGAAGSSIYSWDWALKFILTIATLAAGFQGGEVTPLFAIGASSGVVLASLVGLPAHLCAALGYAAVFGGATNTLLGPIFIGAEVFGFETLPLFFLVCTVARFCNGGVSIYAQWQLSDIVSSAAGRAV